ncbi:rhomboid family intramembrane serine protease [Geminicoccaceae bacterium 1502E]|nr:rhomboid family intramembrane serine protease [Geminicoccaceae bacterium 1502E]
MNTGGRRGPPMVNLPPATKAVAAAMVLAYAAMYVPGLAPFLGLLVFDPLAPMPFWLIGALGYGLLHGSLMHLAGNMLGVVILGPLIERRRGAGPLLILLVLGGLAGALAHSLAQMLTGQWSALIGASASAAALIGWSLRQIRDGRGFSHLDQAVTLYGLFFIGFNLLGVVAFNDSPVAYSAHAGGFVAGWLYGGRGR